MVLLLLQMISKNKLYTHARTYTYNTHIVHICIHTYTHMHVHVHCTCTDNERCWEVDSRLEGPKMYEPIPDNHAKVARERYRYEHVKRASKKLFFNKLELWLTKCKLINEYQPLV